MGSWHVLYMSEPLFYPNILPCRSCSRAPFQDESDTWRVNIRTVKLSPGNVQ